MTVTAFSSDGLLQPVPYIWSSVFPAFQPDRVMEALAAGALVAAAAVLVATRGRFGWPR